MADRIEKHILAQLSKNGRMRTKDIIATLPEEARKIHTRLSGMTQDGRIHSPKRGTYLLPSTLTAIEAQFSEKRKKFSSDARTSENNQETINQLLDTYDEVLVLFQRWILQNIVTADAVDFAQQLRFLENFKWLTMIGDKLMKRWNVEHHGYDTNTRQAQEDAKAKTVEKEKAALADAPIEEKIVVVGHYQEGMQEVLRSLPRKNVEDSTV